MLGILTLGRCLAGIIVFGFSFLFFFMIWQAIQTGELRGRGETTYRWRSPFAFWSTIILIFLFGIFMVLLGLACFGLAPHWFMELLKTMHTSRASH
jgi:hypothetical protein